MILSRNFEVGHTSFPEFTGIQLHMQPIQITGEVKVDGAPRQYERMVFDVLLHASYQVAKQQRREMPRYDRLFLTIDERELKPGETHRRGGAHYDGIYILSESSDPGWNTVNRSMLRQGGLIIAASHLGSCGWTGNLVGEAGPGGDCDHMRDQLDKLECFDLKPNRVYCGDATFVHESVPVQEAMRRQLVRITYA